MWEVDPRDDGASFDVAAIQTVSDGGVLDRKIASPICCYEQYLKKRLHMKVLLTIRTDRVS